METQYKIGVAHPWYLQRFWLKVRNLDDGARDIYCPWYAKPLDFAHGLMFGFPFVELVNQ